MSWAKPPPTLVWDAIRAYLEVVYGAGASTTSPAAAAGSSTPASPQAPTAVRDRLDTLRATPPGDFFDSPVFERDDPKTPTRYALRLGNKLYPHMKFVIERSPDGRTFLFKADTHDQHIRPKPESREYRAFTELMKLNQQTAEGVEAEWARRGMPTFKGYLRQDLARRAAMNGAGTPVQEAKQITN
jgi:hypothetical protein